MNTRGESISWVGFGKHEAGAIDAVQRFDLAASINTPGMFTIFFVSVVAATVLLFLDGDLPIGFKKRAAHVLDVAIGAAQGLVDLFA